MTKPELQNLINKAAHDAIIKVRDEATGHTAAVNMLSAAIGNVKSNTNETPRYETDPETKLTSDNEDPKTVEPTTSEDVRRLVDENYRKGRGR